MAKRPFFISNESGDMWIEKSIEFKYYSGFAVSQKQKSIDSLHKEIKKIYPQKKILEVSTKSPDVNGTRLSAFNLKLTDDFNKSHYLENWFQSGKVFENGGPYVDLLEVSPRDAKKDDRLKNSGALVSFEFKGNTFQLEPKTMFYDWLYINAVNEDNLLSKVVQEYDIFTDIEFNPEKSINCQARSAAIFVSLCRRELLSKALESPQSFKKIVYGKSDNIVQLTLF